MFEYLIRSDCRTILIKNYPPFLIMKTCQFCERQMLRQNFKRHSMSCDIKKIFDAPKYEIIEALELKKNNSALSLIQLKYEKLKHFISTFHRETLEILGFSKEEDIPSKLEELMVSEGTKLQYKSDWYSYSSWCKKQKLDPFLISNANSYLAQLKKKLSTIKNKRSRLQTILSHLLNTPISLKPIKRRISFKPKYVLSQDELVNYLEEQRNENEEDYLIQLILSVYGCRINSVACLQKKHLLFLNRGTKMILPDSKTGPKEVETSPDLIEKLSNYVEENGINRSENFLFTASTTDLRRRSIQICRRINQRIKNSNVLKSNDTHVFSTHMFRKSKAFVLYRKLMEEAKQKVRSEIGQSDNSRAIEHYIN